ncbi:MAG: hypothetical protein J2P49_05790 [Methylocapsa sp.]|nr:hypothetical protein [Methylocapsa sp.]
MSITALSSPPGGVNNASSIASTVPLRAADGDYKVRTSHTSQVKDSDGDYKAITAANSPAAQSSAPVQAALTMLKPGG